MGANVSQREDCAGRELLLHIECPLHDIIAARVRLDIRLLRQWNLAGKSIGWKCAERNSSIAAFQVEWRRSDRRQIEKIRQRQHIVDAKGPPENGQAIVKGSPGEANPRLEIAKSWIGKVARHDRRLRIRELLQDAKPSRGFTGYSGHLVAQA